MKDTRENRKARRRVEAPPAPPSRGAELDPPERTPAPSGAPEIFEGAAQAALRKLAPHVNFCLRPARKDRAS